MRRAGLRLALLLLLLLPALAGAAPRIGLVTMLPGEVYWSRFGHNAILVEGEDGRRLLYNYGFFDFEQPGFLARFLRGRMLYRLAVLPFEQDLGYYAAEGRGVQLQWLDLAPERARRLADFLAWNALPENAEYRYDYFRDNCATRVRDALDEALDGALRDQLSGRSRGLSYRSESLRLAAEEDWLWLGIHAGLGPAADVPLSRWDEGFVPMRLAEAVRLVRTPEGSPLVIGERELLPHRLAAEREDPPQRRWLFVALGLLGAAILGGLGRRGPRHGLAIGLLAGHWLMCGLGGSLLLGLWLATDHQIAYANANLLLLNPLGLALLPALPALARRKATAWMRGIALLIALVGIALPLALALRLIEQDAADFVWLLLPLHLMAAWRLHVLVRSSAT